MKAAPARFNTILAMLVLLASSSVAFSAAHAAGDFTNGETKSISGSQGSQTRYEVTIPSGASGFSVEMSGGSGDADLYVKKGSAPTTSDYQCRPYKTGNNESCPGSGDGTFHIMVNGYSAYSGASLTVSWTEPSGGGGGGDGGGGDDGGGGGDDGGGSSGDFTNGETKSISGSQGSQTRYEVTIPSGASGFSVEMSGGSGDADLYVKKDSAPTTSDYECRPYKTGNNESCPVSGDGTFHIMVNGYSAYSGTSLTVSWTEPSGGGGGGDGGGGDDGGDNYNIGTGVYDITGAIAETGMFGYASGQEVDGLQQRLRSHAYVVQSLSNGKRVVFVSADLGAIFQSVKLEVVKRLKNRYGSSVYNEDNVMLTATHTHVGNGGLSHYSLYITASADASGYGYSSQNFNAVVNGIYKSIVRAHNNLSAGSIELVEGDLHGASKNRSKPAYQANADDHLFSDDTNKKMTLLKFKKANGQEVGMLNWFAVHTTSLSLDYTKISGDSKGYAQQRFEALKGTDFNASETFVAAFANSDEGDVVPTDGNAHSASGYQGSSNELLNAERAGIKQFNKALQLYNQSGEFLDGDLEYRHRYANFENYWVGSAFTGAGSKKLCAASRGMSFAAGGENGPSDIPGIYEGMTKGSFSVSDAVNRVDQSPLGGFIRFLFGAITWGVQDSCQEEKPNLLTTGNLNWVPEVLPFQLFVIGDFAIIGAPAEVTTMAGRRLRATVLDELSSLSVDTAVIAGLANTYSAYLTTYEEFQAQHYEGASTEFGPYTLAAYQQEFSDLATAIRLGNSVSDDKQPPNKLNQVRLERPGVVLDDKFLLENFGDVLNNASSSYSRGSSVTVRFRGGHPKNNLKTQGSFLVVQRRSGGSWVDYRHDWDWDTSYRWIRDGAARSFVDITWRIPSGETQGTYRIKHSGHWKNGWNGSINSYTGYSRDFSVN